MKILVCGGAGYIGSHLVKEILRSTNHEVVVADSLEATKGYDKHLPPTVALEIGDVRDTAFIDAVFTKHAPIDGVVHMCASIVVPDSVRDPLTYYDNNVLGALRMAQAMQRHGVKLLVFSSTAALFGTPDHALIEPDDTKCPESPYGETKLVAERMFAACDAAYGMRTVCLRYFNACGADADGDIGETHDPETHLIPIVLQVALGQRSQVSIFGTDYPTPDGTCVRDYVHVTDLATAHIKALEYLQAGNPSTAFNLGSGNGYSVREIVDACRRVTKHAIPAVEAPRRPGDPPALVASSAKAKEVLGWSPRYTSIDSIVESAWKFHVSHPKGYSGGRPCC
jgi:UDP-glucose 4-epimerase